jgi:hypothetical protein
VTFRFPRARHFHPSADELLATKEKLFVQATETDAELWAERLVHDAVEERRNIVLDGFLTGGSRTVDLIQQACDAAYDVEVQVVAAPAQIAKAQIVDLYEAEKECAGWGMWIPASAYDMAMMSVAVNLHLIEKRVSRLSRSLTEKERSSFRRRKAGMRRKPSSAR